MKSKKGIFIGKRRLSEEGSGRRKHLETGNGIGIRTGTGKQEIASEKEKHRKTGNSIRKGKAPGNRKQHQKRKNTGKQETASEKEKHRGKAEKDKSTQKNEKMSLYLWGIIGDGQHKSKSGSLKK